MDGRSSHVNRGGVRAEPGSHALCRLIRDLRRTVASGIQRSFLCLRSWKGNEAMTVIQRRFRQELMMTLLLTTFIWSSCTCIPRGGPIDFRKSFDEIRPYGYAASGFIEDYFVDVSSEDGAAAKVERWYRSDAVRPDLKRLRALLDISDRSDVAIAVDNIVISMNLEDYLSRDDTPSSERYTMFLLPSNPAFEIRHEPLLEKGQVFLSFDVTVRNGRSKVLKRHRHRLVFSSNSDHATDKPSFLVVSHVVEMPPVDSGDGKNNNHEIKPGE